jgi:hypothetical protein
MPERVEMLISPPTAGSQMLIFSVPVGDAWGVYFGVHREDGWKAYETLLPKQAGQELPPGAGPTELGTYPTRAEALEAGFLRMLERLRRETD